MNSMDNATQQFEQINTMINGHTVLQLFRSTSLFAMSLGYNLLECGSIRSQNAVHTLFKFMIFLAISNMMYWCTGYALAFGYPANGVLGYRSWFAPYNLATKSTQVIDVLFHSMLSFFVSLSSSVAFAERLKLLPSVTYCTLMSGFVYPVVSHWLWSQYGWLSRLGSIDACGCAVLFLTSGIAGLAGSWFLGPRHGRFIPRLLPLFGHNIPIQTLGHVLIFSGFMSLSCSNNDAFEQESRAFGRGVYNTVIAGSSAGLGYYITSYICLMNGVRLKRRFHLSISNSIMAGMISTLSGAPYYELWASFLSGLVVFPLYILFSKLIYRVRIDDPTDTSAVHLSGGLIGMILVSALKGYTKSAWWVLLWNMCASLSIILWTASFTMITFFAFSLIKKYRFSFEDEIKGVDLYKYGEPAYALRIYCASCGDQLQSRMIGRNSICRLDNNNSDGFSNESNKHDGGKRGGFHHHQQQTTIITDAEGAIVPFECLTDRSSNEDYSP